MTELLFLAVSLLLVLICGIFVAAEFAFVTVNRNSVERAARKGDAKAQGVKRALTSLSTQLSGAQVGITITNLAIGFLAGPAITTLASPLLSAAGFPEKAVIPLGATIGIFIATVVTMIFGELIPKNLAIVKPMVVAESVEAPMRVFSRLMSWPIKLLNGSANFFLKQVGVTPQEELASARSADELLSLVRRSAQKGTLPKGTAKMLERSLNFSDLTALDVMTPRIRMATVPADASVAEILDAARSSGLSRFPVHGTSHDDIVGVVHIKHALAIPKKNRQKTSAAKIMRPPVLVPSNVPLESLLAALRKGGLQMAIVIDEFGGTDGIVTIEDLLEELVGEVHDEHDRLKAPVVKNPNGTWTLSGLLRPDEVGEATGIFLPEDEDSETIAGLIADQLERLPKLRDSVKLPVVNREGEKMMAELKVKRMDGHRVDKVQMSIEAYPIDEGETT